MIYLLFGFFLIFMGLSVHMFKWYFLISGYNTMPKEKREKVDTKGLGLLMGIYGYFNGALFLLFGILELSGIKTSLIIAAVIFTLSTIGLLIRAQKYDGNVRQRRRKYVNKENTK